MLRLIQVELKKAFKKKSIYIIWFLMLIFCLLNNILYFTDYDKDGNYKYLEQDNLKEEKNKLEQELTKYDKDNSNETSMYLTIKTKLDIISLKQQFKDTSWQYHKINDYLYDTIYQLNYLKDIAQNNQELEKTTNTYELIMAKLKSNDYTYFLNQDIKNTTTLKKELTEKYQQETDVLLKQELKTKISENEFDLKILNFRLANNIKEDNSYLNKALESYQENSKTIDYYNKLSRPKTNKEQLNFMTSLANTKISQYIITNKKNINKQNNLNYQLRTIVEDYEIFIIMLILITSSSIICDEFKDGTIKLLLIKPYSRGKILLSKYFTSIIIVAISILILIAMQLIIGGIIFNFDSLNIPVVVYDFNKSKLVEYQVIEYMLIRIAAKAPLLLMLITITILLGILSNSSIISITMPLMLYLFTPTLTSLATKYQLTFMKYLVNINWNLENYLFGNLPEISFINFKFSSIILLGHFITLLILTFWLFQKKNIKNI